MTIKDLASKLQEGGYALVVGNGRVATFTRPGVADLLAILNDEPELLRGALVADKVVGKAAAALMIEGGVQEVYASTLSQQAAALLDAYSVKRSCGEMVDHIVNRDGTGWCPMEMCCRDCTTPQECHAAIIKKIAEFKNRKQ